MTTLEELDQMIQKKHLLNHPFYVVWSQGLLTKECLKEYAKEYYHHVRAFPMYLSALHSRTSDPCTRKEILKNLIDEEAGSPNHPEMWRSFAQRLGASDEEIDAHKPCQEIQTLIGDFQKICKEGSVGEGIAALYAYESQIPEICKSKIAGLKSFYGLTKPSDWTYFSVHIAADEEHAATERKLLAKYLSDDKEVKKAVNTVLDNLWNFLTALCDKYNIACAM